jgi:hypothetical protein
MVWDAHSKNRTELLLDERERAMGFRTCTKIAPSIFGGQRHLC